MSTPYDPEATAALPQSPAQPPAGHHPGEPARSWASWAAPSSEGHYETPAPPAPNPGYGAVGGSGPTADHGSASGSAGHPGYTAPGAYGSASGPAGPDYASPGGYRSASGAAPGDAAGVGYGSTSDTAGGYGTYSGYGTASGVLNQPPARYAPGPELATPAHPYGPPATKQPRKPRTPWLAVAAAAVLAAGLASGGTAAILSAQDEPAGQHSSAPSAAGQSAPIQTAADSGPDWETVADTVRPAVVAIEVTSQGGAGAGSGMVWDEQGHIVTNNHVIDGAQQIVVTLNDGRMFEAEPVGTDPMTDLAVLELVDAPSDLELASMGSAEDLQVGRPVMAVGNPLGLSSTVTTGIISALDRPVTAGEGGQAASVTNAIQIDAAINPGNSGGPLFDAQGQVIGITSSIAALSGGQSGNIGLGFAIPADLVTNIVEQLVEGGEAEHAYLGVTLSADTVSVDGAVRSGAAVHSVQAGSPAAEAGLEEGDVITAIGDRPTSGPEALTGYVRAHTAGDEVALTLVRDGEVIEEQVTLATTAEQIA